MKLSSNSVAISDVLKKQKPPETGFSQHKCGGDRDTISTRLFWEGWHRYYEMRLWTHECGPHSCVLMRIPPDRVWFDIHLHSSTGSSSVTISLETPPRRSVLSHFLAGFRLSCSASVLTSFSAQVSTWSLRTPQARRASTHVGCMWPSPPMQHGDSVPWQRLQVQNLHVKMLR